tara:strand:+ start:515 stop:649 length:135 start_codon:yes stop_codon:yes gene_type:complete
LQKKRLGAENKKQLLLQKTRTVFPGRKTRHKREETKKKETRNNY